MTNPELPNVAADLVRIHGVITRGLQVALEGSKTLYRAGYPDDSTRDGYVDYVRTLVSVTHGHHLTEDDVAFPYFRELLPGAPWDALTEQHGEMQALLDQIEAAVDALLADLEDRGGLLALLAALVRLSELWRPHIQTEEAHLSVAKGAELVSLDEHIRLAQLFGQHSQEHAGPDYLVVPFMLYNMPPEDRAVMAGNMPPIVTQQLVPVVWKDKWAPMKPFLLD